MHIASFYINAFANQVARRYTEMTPGAFRIRPAQAGPNSPANNHRIFKVCAGWLIAFLGIRLEPELHSEFVAVCKKMNVSGSAVIRNCIQAFVDRQRDSTQTDLFAPNKLEPK